MHINAAFVVHVYNILFQIYYTFICIGIHVFFINCWCRFVFDTISLIYFIIFIIKYLLLLPLINNFFDKFPLPRIQ